MWDLNSQRIVNQPMGDSDGATFLEVAKWVFFSATVVLLLLSSASIRSQILSVQYEIEELKRSNERLVAQNDQLVVEYKSMATPAEIEAAARELGLISSNQQGILIIEDHSFGLETDHQLAHSELEGDMLRE